ncbi:MAG: glycosyltransferase [Bacteroidetes bacterium]|nr:glycosyltransferase [Bacteroidota bacterium]
MIAYVFFTLLAALTAVYMLFLFRLRAGLRHIAQQPQGELPSVDDARLPAVTVLVPARNEAEQIDGLVASLRAQRYPVAKMEVLLLDDHSEDATHERAAAAILGDARFRLLAMPEEGKKAAITQGVQAACGDIIVTTDADCTHDEDWLRAMSAPFLDGADVVAGPVVYQERTTLFERLQALEFLGLMGVGAGFFGIGYPRLCNGANFAYRRALFAAVAGFEGNDGVHSGDDEFLLHKIVYREGGNAQFATAPASVVRTSGAPTLRAFLRQRIRWASKGRSYDDGRFVSFLVMLFVYFLFAATAPLVSISSPAAMAAGMFFFVLKIIADVSVLYASAALFRQPVRLSDLLAGEVLHAYYLVFVSIIGFSGGYTWKNRRVRNHRI